MAGRPADGLVPTFITSHLPVGFRGLLVAAILGLLPLAALSIPGA